MVNQMDIEPYLMFSSYCLLDVGQLWASSAARLNGFTRDCDAKIHAATSWIGTHVCYKGLASYTRAEQEAAEPEAT